MSVSDFLLGPRRSLRRQLLLNISAALSLCLLLAGIVLVDEFKEHLRENREDALMEEAKEVIGQVDPRLDNYGLNPDAVRFRGVDGNYRYTVFSADGVAVAGAETSDAIWRQLSALELGTPRMITLPGARIGLGMRASILEQNVFVLVSTFPKDQNESQIARLFHEVEEAIWRTLFGLTMVVVAAVLATRRSLQPLRALSEQAREIGPLAANRRLDVEAVPTELVPLIGDVNEAFDRLEQGYKAQKDFSSNVAHEIRTPIAVLKSSIDRIQDTALKQTLTQDAEQLDRIFGQLIDLARADAALMSDFEPVDLRALAAETATDFARDAIRQGRSISVTGAKDVWVGGHAGLLSIGLGNLIKNALHYTAEHSEVEIEVLSNPCGWRVLDRGPGVPDGLKLALFERFNRGAQATSKDTGSGIGLAIVKSVANCHGASVYIEDRTDGGSIFSFIFNADT